MTYFGNYKNTKRSDYVITLGGREEARKTRAFRENERAERREKSDVFATAAAYAVSRVSPYPGTKNPYRSNGPESERRRNRPAAAAMSNSGGEIGGARTRVAAAGGASLDRQHESDGWDVVIANAAEKKMRQYVKDKRKLENLVERELLPALANYVASVRIRGKDKMLGETGTIEAPLQLRAVMKRVLLLQKKFNDEHVRPFASSPSSASVRTGVDADADDGVINSANEAFWRLVSVTIHYASERFRSKNVATMGPLSNPQNRYDLEKLNAYLLIPPLGVSFNFVEKQTTSHVDMMNLFTEKLAEQSRTLDVLYRPEISRAYAELSQSHRRIFDSSVRRRGFVDGETSSIEIATSLLFEPAKFDYDNNSRTRFAVVGSAVEKEKERRANASSTLLRKAVAALFGGPKLDPKAYADLDAPSGGLNVPSRTEITGGNDPSRGDGSGDGGGTPIGGTNLPIFDAPPTPSQDPLSRNAPGGQFDSSQRTPAPPQQPPTDQYVTFPSVDAIGYKNGFAVANWGEFYRQVTHDDPPSEKGIHETFLRGFNEAIVDLADELKGNPKTLNNSQLIDKDVFVRYLRSKLLPLPEHAIPWVDRGWKYLFASMVAGIQGITFEGLAPSRNVPTSITAVTSDLRSAFDRYADFASPAAFSSQSSSAWDIADDVARSAAEKSTLIVRLRPAKFASYDADPASRSERNVKDLESKEGENDGTEEEEEEEEEEEAEEEDVLFSLPSDLEENVDYETVSDGTDEMYEIEDVAKVSGPKRKETTTEAIPDTRNAPEDPMHEGSAAAAAAVPVVTPRNEDDWEYFDFTAAGGASSASTADSREEEEETGPASSDALSAGRSEEEERSSEALSINDGDVSSCDDEILIEQALDWDWEGEGNSDSS